MSGGLSEKSLEYKGYRIAIWCGVGTGAGKTGWPFADGLVVAPHGERYEISQEAIDRVLLLDASSSWRTEEEACEYLAARIEERAKALIDSLSA